ncbi:hypothetical protein ABZP36_018025 [Zizania latifolia]
MQRRRAQTWAGVGKTAQAAAAHAALFCFTLLLVLRVDGRIAYSWWIIFIPLWLFHGLVARGRFSMPAPSLPHGRRWAPCHSIVAAPLLIAFELLLCIFLESLRVRNRPAVDLKIVFLPLLVFEVIILIDNFRMCRALMPGDEESISDEAIWETLHDTARDNFHQYAQDPGDQNTGRIYQGSNFLGDPLPGIEGFQISGHPIPGSTLTACGFPTNGTTLCNFQWVRYLENGTRQSIEGATVYDHVVTADDVDTILAVDCTPMDDNGRQGELVTEFANGGKKITCDQEMQSTIDVCISNGRAQFNVFVLPGYSSDEWELAILTLKRTGYHIKVKDEVLAEEKYSPDLQMKIPNGRTTQFVLVSSGGVNLPFNTGGITEPNNDDSDVRLRDLIVLVMRTFQNKALDAKRKGKV